MTQSWFEIARKSSGSPTHENTKSGRLISSVEGLEQFRSRLPLEMFEKFRHHLSSQFQFYNLVTTKPKETGPASRNIFFKYTTLCQPCSWLRLLIVLFKLRCFYRITYLLFPFPGGGLMVCTLVPGASGPRSSPGQGTLCCVLRQDT